MTDFEIFKASFPEYKLTEELFDMLSGKNSCRIFRKEGGTAFMNKNKLSFLAVASNYRGKGVGTALLKECESYVKAEGYDRIGIGGFFPGLPVAAQDFFVKNGFETCGEFVEMGMEIRKFTADKSHAPVSAEFGFFDGKHDDLLAAVAEVDEEWVQYFSDDEKVFCGFVNGELASFCIVDESVQCLLSDGKSKVGSIGCVGTRPAFRKRGIGLYMVELATELLSEKGCDKSFIHCTHLENWYKRLGYRTFLRYTAGRKIFE